MSRYIDAENIAYFIDERGQILARKELIDDIKTADVEPVRHGHWIPHKMIARSPFAKNYDCSECGCENFYYPSCPYCRALMDGKEKE